jgi:phosphoribosylanthranilate isomerase
VDKKEMIGRTMTRIKICGITNVEDALAAVELGADAVGFVFAESKRRVSPETGRSIAEALPPFVTTVGVFMDERIKTVEHIAEYVRLDAVQLHGTESPEYCERLSKKKKVIKRIHVHKEDTAESLETKMKPYCGVAAFLIDPGAGDGKAFNWQIAEAIRQPVIIAGGLTPENVREAVRRLNPVAVDVSSGVEKEIGKKDYDKMKKFISEVR